MARIKEIIYSFGTIAGIVGTVLGAIALSQNSGLGRRIENTKNYYNARTTQLETQINEQYQRLKAEVKGEIDSKIDSTKKYADSRAQYWSARYSAHALNQIEEKIKEMEAEVEITKRNVHTLFEWSGPTTQAIHQLQKTLFGPRKP